MVFAVVGGTQETGYEIENSLRFNDDDSPKVSRSISSSGSARNATLSVWVKRGNLGTRQQIYSNKTADSAFSGMNMYFNASNDRLYIDHHDGTNNRSLYATQVFRDTSAWYHIVHTIDTTTGTATNRLRLYINGTEVTDFATDQAPDQNADLALTNSTGDQSIGDDPRDNNDLFDGYMAEYNFVDGTTLDPTYFGEFNNNGVWVPKEPNVSSYGTNGFYLEFKQTGTSANSSGIGADTSGNDNHMSVTNLAATDVTTDTPTNNFTTLNPLAVSRFSSGNAAVFAEGNCQIATQTSDNDRVLSVSTFGVTSGKWYWEIKAVVAAQCETGVCEANTVLGYSQHYNNETSPPAITVSPSGHIYGKGGEDYDDHENWAADLSNNDIIMWALDMDNYELWHGINGTWTDSGDPTSGATGTGGIVNESGNAYRTNLNHGEPMFPMVQDGGTGSQMKAQLNFGNSPFSISSGNADANGYGNFEYAVPSGFYALCTKNLAEFG